MKSINKKIIDNITITLHGAFRRNRIYKNGISANEGKSSGNSCQNNYLAC
jgi:hypothetical protein